MNLKKLVKAALPDDAVDEIKRIQCLLKKNKFESSDYEGREKLISKWFRKKRGYGVNFRNPQSFSEKIQWMKLYDQPITKGVLADKYLARAFVEERIGAEHLVPLLGVWDNAEDIDFDILPDKFVLKATHGAGMNIIVDSKDRLDRKKTVKRLNRWLTTAYAYEKGYEYHYSNCVPRIIAEEYIEGAQDLLDYKVFCFSGKPEFVQVIGGRKKKTYASFFNLAWEEVAWRTETYPSPNEVGEPVPVKPARLQELLTFAELLSEDFSAVRVDFYITESNIFFGELTFTPGTGAVKWLPEEFDFELGKKVHLEKNKPDVRGEKYRR